MQRRRSDEQVRLRTGVPCLATGFHQHPPFEQHVFADGEGERTGWWLVEAMQASPCRDVDLEPGRERMPVRDVEL
jgi:hypothetical protein